MTDKGPFRRWRLKRGIVFAPVVKPEQKIAFGLDLKYRALMHHYRATSAVALYVF